MFEKYFQKLFFISDLCVNGDFLLEEFRTAKENEKTKKAAFEKASQMCNQLVCRSINFTLNNGNYA